MNPRRQYDSRTSPQVREVAKELTRYGLIEAVRKPNLYRVLQNQQRVLTEILEPLDLDFVVDDVQGIAFMIIRTVIAHLASPENVQHLLADYIYV